MEVRWLHFKDITSREVATIVKVLSRRGARTRVLLSNGMNELIPSPLFHEEPPIEVGDKVVMLPSPDGRWDVNRDAAIQAVVRMRKFGLPDYALDHMPSYLAEAGRKIKPLE